MPEKLLSRDLQRSIVAYSAASTLVVSVIVAVVVIALFYHSLPLPALGLVAAGTFGVVLLRPLAGKLGVHADELEQRVREETAALEAERKERARAEEDLRASEMRFHSLTQSANDAIITADEQGTIVSWNPGARRIFGWEESEAVGTLLTDLVAESSREAHLQGLERMRTTGEPQALEKRLELEGLRRDGSSFPFQMSLGSWNIRDGQLTTAIIRDVTERKQAEKGVSRMAAVEEQLARAHAELKDRDIELRQALADLQESHEALEEAQLELIQAVKMESVGQLAAGVAHEVKNPLAIILVGISYLSHHLPLADKNVSMALDDIRDAIRRADAVIGGLLNYSAKRRLEITVDDLSAIVDQALLLIKHRPTQNHVTVLKELGENLPLLLLDKTKIEQVFVNLFMNAIDAMSEGGTLTVRTYVTTLTRSGRQMGVRATDHFRIGETVVVAEVEDTGSGIDEADMARIFDPFFTTKPTGKGTGLGLAVTKTIIELHQGTIDIRNREEGGVRVTVMFKTDR